MQRQKDALQRQMDMYHEQTQNSSPSHALYDPEHERKTAPPSSVPQAMWDNIAHKRSASDEVYRGQVEPEKMIPPEQVMCLKERLHLNQQTHIEVGVGNAGAFVTEHGQEEKPIHLAMSVTNERRHQQGSLKSCQSLSNTHGPGTMGIKRNTSYVTPSGGAPVQQILPYHLSGKDRSSHTASNPSIPTAVSGSPQHQVMSRNRSTSFLRTDSPERIDNQHSNTTITRSNTQSNHTPGVKQQISLHNQRSSYSASLLPMQLAEREKKRPRSASANLGSSTQQRNASSQSSSRTSSVSAQDRVLLHYYKPGLKVRTGWYSQNTDGNGRDSYI